MPVRARAGTLTVKPGAVAARGAGAGQDAGGVLVVDRLELDQRAAGKAAADEGDRLPRVGRQLVRLGGESRGCGGADAGELDEGWLGIDGSGELGEATRGLDADRGFDGQGQPQLVTAVSRSRDVAIEDHAIGVIGVVILDDGSADGDRAGSFHEPGAEQVKSSIDAGTPADAGDDRDELQGQTASAADQGDGAGGGQVGNEQLHPGAVGGDGAWGDDDRARDAAVVERLELDLGVEGQVLTDHFDQLAGVG